MSDAHPEFIDEPIVPVPGTADAKSMAVGLPGLPQQFQWRGRRYTVRGLVRAWKTSGPCRNGSAEMYLRRHWYEVLTEPPAVMVLYCDRQAKGRKHPKARWWLFTIEPVRTGALPGQ